MKKLVALMCAVLVLAGCRTMPDLNDTTAPELTFSIYYLGTRLNAPTSEIAVTSSIEARRCVYVNFPFRVAASAFDRGGISMVRTGFSGDPASLVALDGPEDILALPVPADRTWPPGSTSPNPGKLGTGNVEVHYSPASAYPGVVLYAIFDFAPGYSNAALQATTYNFGAGAIPTQVFHFHIAKASDDPLRRPGMPCAVPTD